MISKALVGASTKPLLLSLLLAGESYGYELIQRVKEISGGRIEWADNMLYPVLRRMEQEGQVVSRWKMSKEGRLRNYYRITESGRKELEAERRQWSAVRDAMDILWKPLPALD